MRNIAVRPSTSVIVSRGKARDFLNEVTPVLEVSPARYYDLILSSFNYTGESAGSELIDFYSAGQVLGREPYAVISEISSGESDNNKVITKFAGLAVFNGWRMVGEIDPSLTKAHLLLTNGLRESAMVLDDVVDPSLSATLIIKQTKTPKFDIKIEDDSAPTVKVTLYVDANLNSTTSSTDYLDDTNKHKLNVSIEDKITSMVEEYVEVLKSLNSDIAGIGRFAKVKFSTWDEFEKFNWKEKFKDINYEVKTKVNLSVYQTIFHKLPNK